MSERPTPDLEIVETRVYRGPNVWSYERAIHLVVDLGGLEQYPTDKLPGFADHLVEASPGRRPALVLRGRRGGFVERLHEGTWLGHVTEHCALGLQQVVGHDIRRGKTRGVKGEPGRYNVIYGYQDENVGLAAGRLAARLVNHLVQADPEFDWDDELERLHPPRRADGVRTLDPGAGGRGREPRHPVDQAQPVLPRPARSGRPRQAHPGDDDVRDELDRRRRGLRQGPHHQAARSGRPAGAQAGVRPQRRPGRRRSASDRLPGRGQAARRQPRPRRLPQPENDDDVRTAYPVAEEQSRRGTCIVESFVTGKDYRCLIIDGRMAAIAERVPASVTGDGTSTVEAARRPHQRRPPTRRRAREGAHQDQARRGGRGGARGPGPHAGPPCRPRARW